MAPAQPWRSSAHPYHTLSLSCACRSASAGIAYVTVAGAAIKGNAARPDESESGVTRGVDPSDPTLPARELLSGAARTKAKAALTEADEVCTRHFNAVLSATAHTMVQHPNNSC